MSENKTAKTPADGEPVAWVCREVYGFAKHCDECKQLYTEPPKREWVGLTDDDIWDVMCKVDSFMYRTFARELEKKIKEKNS